MPGQWISLGLDINSCPISPAEIYGIENIAEYIYSHLEENIHIADIDNLISDKYITTLP